jgi:hypothetical protein
VPPHEIEQRIKAIKAINTHGHRQVALPEDNDVSSQSWTIVLTTHRPSGRRAPSPTRYLVSTHYQFGHYEQALDAIHETLRAA